MDNQLIAFKVQLNALFESSDSGPVGYFLGFNVHQNRSGQLYISQEHYLEAILDRFPCKIPLPSGFRLLPATNEEFALARHQPYPQIVGSILYAATVSRPDLARPASVLSPFIWDLGAIDRQLHAYHPPLSISTYKSHPAIQ